MPKGKFKKSENFAFEMDPAMRAGVNAAGNPAAAKMIVDTNKLTGGAKKLVEGVAKKAMKMDDVRGPAGYLTPNAVMQLTDDQKRNLVSGNNVTIDSGGTTLNTSVQGESKSNSTTVNKSGGSGTSYSEAYKNADKTKYPTLASFTEAAKAYNKSKSSSSSSSSKPSVSTEKKTNISVDNLLKPKLDKIQSQFATRQFNNTNTEIQAITDSTATSNALANLSKLGALGSNEKAAILRDVLPNARNNTYIKSARGRTNRGGNVLGPLANDTNFINYVSGRAADAARAAGNSDKPAQSQEFAVSSDGVYPRNYRFQSQNFGGPKDNVSTKDATGFTYEEIKEKSGEKTMQMASNYFNRKRNKK
jgi:hypothetical protein